MNSVDELRQMNRMESFMTESCVTMWLCIIEDAMRRDTAAPENWSLAFRDPFWHVLFSGCCLSILWLILLDLG